MTYYVSSGSLNSTHSLTFVFSFLVVSTSAIDCMEILVAEMLCIVLCVEWGINCSLTPLLAFFIYHRLSQHHEFSFGDVAQEIWGTEFHSSARGMGMKPPRKLEQFADIVDRF